LVQNPEADRRFKADRNPDRSQATGTRRKTSDYPDRQGPSSVELTEADADRLIATLDDVLGETALQGASRGSP
jgi:hypothetical protein